MARSILHLSPSISMTYFPKTSIAPPNLFANPLGGPRAHPMVLKLGRGATVKCMANQRRVQKVAKQIMREIADMLVTDKVVNSAVLPEAAFGADLYLSSLTTVSDVEISNDLQVAKVYISVFGDERGKKVALAGLKAKSKYVRHQLGKRMRLRMTPEVRFIEDESQERGSRVIEILDRLKWEQENGPSNDEEWSDDEEGESRGDDSDEEDRGEEEYEEDGSGSDSGNEKEDPDEDIIYVD